MATLSTTATQRGSRRDVHGLDFGFFGPGVKRNFRLAKFLTLHHIRMHKEIFKISNTLRKLMI